MGQFLFHSSFANRLHELDDADKEAAKGIMNYGEDAQDTINYQEAAQDILRPPRTS